VLVLAGLSLVKVGKSLPVGQRTVFVPEAQDLSA
jgi:hypothetical protein